MKKFYLLSLLIFSVLLVNGQDPITSHALKGTCLNPDEGTIDFIFDLNENCPEADPNGILPGTEMMGFHSGANDWASIVGWDTVPPLMNNGADTFKLSVDIFDYYGVPFGDLTDVQIVINNGIADPEDPWTVAFRDSLDGEAFGNLEPCSNLRLIIATTPTCSDLNQSSSLVLFSDAGDAKTCVDADEGLIRIDMDYGIACPEADTSGLLAGASSIGFHSGANDWAEVVEWNDPSAVQLVNDGADNFSAIIDAADYYGIPFADIDNIVMIGNNGPNDPDNPWDVSLRDPIDGGSFGNPNPCSDIKMILAEAPACDLSLNTENVVLKRSMKVSPNPFHTRAFLEFDNPTNELFDLVVTDMMGRVVRTVSAISGERYLLERVGLPDGMYLATLRDESGDFATTKLVIR